MRYSVFLLGMLLLLAACDTSLKAKPIGEGGLFGSTTALDACAEISCGKNALCTEGACACTQGYKDCNAEDPGQTCAPTNGCCTDSDCKKDEICNEQSQCEFSCDNFTCDSNKICYPKQKGCFCPDGYRWCDLQNLCIPNESCCGKFDCTGDKSCTKTIESARLCFIGKEKSCNYIGTLKRDFTVDGNTYTVEAKKFHYNEKILIEVDSEAYELKTGDNVTLGNITMHLEIIKTTGGQCQTRE